MSENKCTFRKYILFNGCIYALKSYMASARTFHKLLVCSAIDVIAVPSNYLRVRI